MSEIWTILVSGSRECGCPERKGDTKVTGNVWPLLHVIKIFKGMDTKSPMPLTEEFRGKVTEGLKILGKLPEDYLPKMGEIEDYQASWIYKPGQVISYRGYLEDLLLWVLTHSNGGFLTITPYGESCNCEKCGMED